MSQFGPPDVDKLKAKGDVKGLIKALNYVRYKPTRTDAARVLGEIGDPQAVEPLITALKDKTWDVRKAAAEALGEIGDARAVEIARLLTELEAATYVQRLEAADALGRLGDQAALPALERMSHGTGDLWVLFDEGKRERARMVYPNGVIPASDEEILWPGLSATNDLLKGAAQAAIAQIRETAGIATPEEAAMKVFNDAYVVRHNPELDEAVAKALDAIHASQDGLTTLLDRLCDGVVIADGRIRTAGWGDRTWNELLKKREIVRCLQRAKDGRALSKLRDLLQAECSLGQWAEIVRPALGEAVDAIESTSSGS